MVTHLDMAITMTISLALSVNAAALLLHNGQCRAHHLVGPLILGHLDMQRGMSCLQKAVMGVQLPTAIVMITLQGMCTYSS